MTTIITPGDLAPFATISEAAATAMIEDAMAMAVRVAPCLKDTSDEDLMAAAKAVLRRSILRWHETGASGSRKQVSDTAGAYSHSETSETAGPKGLFWPSEIAELGKLCQDSTRDTPSGAYTINMTGLSPVTNPLAGVVVNGDATGLEPIRMQP